MTGMLFEKWLSHFVKYSNASVDRKVLLILDGHSSHKYLPALEYAKKHGVVLLCTPPHCTHRIQPLDVSFFGPLSNYYNQAITKWMKANPARTVTAFQVGQLFSEAYEKAAVMGNAVSGFKTTGIYPPNPDIFPEWMFSPSDVTNLVLEEPSDQTDLTEPGCSGLQNQIKKHPLEMDTFQQSTNSEQETEY
ncbi:uncharacterized protein LOC115877213 [Sitophilus oryzae]|uniref:Uncharacterized protein LOC115877213 n=1 Tax=Sitophilus oryzae TaxID=7048 RepID=A0A6J2XDB4_SITOR|nr:uncharacterized protein LOC115877213 [Sitophilus oryzae]